MDYEVITACGAYVFKDLERAYERFDIEDKAILVKHGYIDGEYYCETIENSWEV